jgi:hypothetical protein
MRRFFIAGALAAIGAAAIAIPASGAQSFDFHLDAISTGTHFNQAHNVVTFTNRLVQHGDRDDKVGHNRGRCRIKTRTRSHCHIVYFFSNGKVKTQGRSNPRSQNSRLPVVGGTRAFNGVAGKVLTSGALNRVTHLHFVLVK